MIMGISFLIMTFGWIENVIDSAANVLSKTAWTVVGTEVDVIYWNALLTARGGHGQTFSSQ
jgi:hypothetical protein